MLKYIFSIRALRPCKKKTFFFKAMRRPRAAWFFHAPLRRCISVLLRGRVYLNSNDLMISGTTLVTAMTRPIST
jgi:hypothetical protein